MNTHVFESKWKQLKGKVKTQWGKLTDDEISKIEGRKDRLAGLLQNKYGKAKDVIDREIDDFIDKQSH